MKKTLCFSFLICSLAVHLGCGGDDGSPKNYVKTTGVVTLDDKPFADATVNFLATDAAGGAGGIGMTDKDGKFVIKYRGLTEGLPPAKYKVTISKFVKADGSPIPAGISPLEAGGVEAVSAVYSDFNQTTLSATVEATPKEHPINLKSN